MALRLLGSQDQRPPVGCLGQGKRPQGLAVIGKSAGCQPKWDYGRSNQIGVPQGFHIRGKLGEVAEDPEGKQRSSLVEATALLHK